MKPLLTLHNISKSYDGHPALTAVSLILYPGEIHGLAGENGAGKTTLLRILSGQDNLVDSGGYSGALCWQGEELVIRSPDQAAKLGIGMVHQEFMLFPDLSIAENIMARRENTVAWTRRLFSEPLAYLDKPRDLSESRAALEKLGVKINPTFRVHALSVNSKQFVELAREIARPNLKLLILDEPTAALGPDDAARLLNIVRDIAAQGTAVLFVSHRLEETMAICDQISVLRDGKIQAQYVKSEFDLETIATAMIGKQLSRARRTTYKVTAPAIIRLKDFGVKMPDETLSPVNLEIRQGEILGVTGLPGHGKLALGAGLMGLGPSVGNVWFENRRIVPWKQGKSQTAAMLAAGICMVHDDRRQAGLLPDRAVADNITFTAIQQGHFRHPVWGRSFGWISRNASSTAAAGLIASMDIRCQGLYQPVRELSGGNQQKVCLARAVLLAPKVLIVHEPTRGVDIGAKEMLMQVLLDLNELHGTTMVIASSELGELKRLCDRIIVLYEGHISAILSPDSCEREFALAYVGKGERLA